MNRTSRVPANLSESLHQRLNSYALAASAAGVGFLALAPPAAAKIVYTKAHVVLLGHSNSYYHLDLNHDGIRDFDLLHIYSISTSKGGLSTFRSNVLVPYFTNHRSNRVAASNGNAYAFLAGAKIGTSAHFSTGAALVEVNGPPPGPPNNSYGAWANGGKGLRNGYLGLRFVIKGKNHFGWARVSVSKWPLTATLTGYAYETIPNKPIIAGKTKGPDVITLHPGSLGAFAAGGK